MEKEKRQHCCMFYSVRGSSRQPRDEFCFVDLTANIEDGCDLTSDSCRLEGWCEGSSEDGCEVFVKKIANLVAKTDANLAANLACQMATNM